MVEALLAGCRVVCSDIPAFREVGMEACHYVPLGSGEVGAFAQAVHDTRNSPRILPISMPWLSASTVAEKYMTLYRRVQTRLVDRTYSTLRVSQIGSRDGA